MLKSSTIVSWDEFRGNPNRFVTLVHVPQSFDPDQRVRDALAQFEGENAQSIAKVRSFVDRVGQELARQCLGFLKRKDEVIKSGGFANGLDPVEEKLVLDFAKVLSSHRQE